MGTKTKAKKKYLEWECTLDINSGTTIAADNNSNNNNDNNNMNNTQQNDNCSRKVERLRLQMKHDIDREMRLVEVVIFREKLASSAVALAEDYLAANLSKSPKLHSKELATAACYAGEPLPLQVQ